jgi:hypothetical protein
MTRCWLWYTHRIGVRCAWVVGRGEGAQQAAGALNSFNQTITQHLESLPRHCCTALAYAATACSSVT